jgi:hypothetical protein
MEYKIANQSSLLIVRRMSGNSRSISLDLPPEVLKAMAFNDLHKNRLRYSKKYLLGKKIFA